MYEILTNILFLICGSTIMRIKEYDIVKFQVNYASIEERERRELNNTAMAFEEVSPLVLLMYRVFIAI